MDNLNRVNFFKMNSIGTPKLNGNLSINSDETKVKDFKNIIADMIYEMNETTNQPEQLAKEAMLGQADVHDVMTAIAKSELTVQAATTITGKILQTYEKIMQIQI